MKTRYEVITIYEDQDDTKPFLKAALNGGIGRGGKEMSGIGDNQMLVFIGENRMPSGTCFYTLVVENLPEITDFVLEAPDEIEQPQTQLEIPEGSADERTEL